MEPEFTPFTDGFLRKVRALHSGVAFFEHAHLDAAARLQEHMVDDVLTNQYVGVISGNLRRSQEVAPSSRFSSLLFTDIVVAPYALFVLRWSRRKYGKDFIRITLDLYLARTLDLMEKEFNRMVGEIRQGRIYKYQNPFT